MMQHEEGNKFDLMKYRMESAKSDLKSAKILIKGGVAITYHDKSENIGAIGIFTAYKELNDILKKVNG